MIVVIIAGGSGTRLWPLSTNNFPKHLLALVNERSLLQNTFDRVKMMTSADKIYVVTDASHSDHVFKQLPEMDDTKILVEPARRGTASCVLYALSQIEKDFGEDQPVFFLWADHLVRNVDGFASSILRAANIAESLRKLVFIGIEPSYPATGFEYIKMGERLTEWYGASRLVSFIKRPDAKVAKQFIDTGKYLWNSGYLVGMNNDIKEAMQQLNPELYSSFERLKNASSKEFLEVYASLEPLTIEVALSQFVTDAVVVEGSFDWADVGSFGDLHKVSLLDDEGNHVTGGNVFLEAASNSYVRNHTDTPVAVVGLDGVMVINTPQGILVANANHAQKIGDVAKRIQSKQ
jgi:mannose-1-phosphate guanylyltransferase